MKTTSQTHQLFNFSPETVEEIKDIQDYDNDGFLAYSRALDNLFYEYILAMLHNPANNIVLESGDVYCLKQIKRLLELLQKSTTEIHYRKSNIITLLTII